MEKYSKAVSEMYSQFEKREAHPAEKYIGRLANFYGKKLEVVGYSRRGSSVDPLLIIEALPFRGWSALEPSDVIFKDCEYYWYISINDLIE